MSKEVEEYLDYLKANEYIWGYEKKDNYIVLRYGLSSVKDTERVIDINGKDLKKALFESGEDIRVDIESSLVDDNDFFGYDNAEELENRIVEETEFLKELSELV